MKRFPKVLKKIFYVAVAVLIPGLLILNAIQAERYMKIEREIKELEKKQVQLVEENEKLITDISLLSSSQRIGAIAENDLGMHKAESEEIVRVEMEKKK
ncbi:MAG: cell division protein FtsL [Treponema sp.]|uniref:cell division protein FtsL n=1 Tax=Treponema sp. TaxID=166 RepID=UPI001B514E6E|nr:cell division protein FtsL [Treponema sp.]MBP5587172.1 cell division protein FtsL [Treponema sp.]